MKQGGAAAGERYLEPRSICVNRPGERPVYLPIYSDRTYTFGRAPESDVVFSQDSVSRHHGRLFYRSDGRWVYQDCESTNGSCLSEFPVETESETWVPLSPEREQVVSVGQSLVLTRGCRVSFLLELTPSTLPPRTAQALPQATQQLEGLVLEAALHRLPVLLLGPTGSGKTFLARRIHALSSVRGAFEAVNCGALSNDPNQLRSELLGHVAGAYTGASQPRVGKLRHADGGTLFLDEVESMPPEAQRFFLDLLERSGSFAPMGAPAGEVHPPPRFRLLAATQNPLAKSNLRQDLVFRLGRGVVIRIPDLAQRREEIPTLVDAFLRRLREEQDVTVRFSAAAVERLQERKWPGHIRQLEGVVLAVAERAVARSQLRRSRPVLERSQTRIVKKVESTEALIAAVRRLEHERESNEPQIVVEVSLQLLDEHLEQHQDGLGLDPQEPAAAPAATLGLRKRPQDYTADELEAALGRNHQVLKRAAAELGMAVNTFKFHLERLGIRSPGEKPAGS